MQLLPYTISLVEDEPVLREEMAFQLRHMGFAVQAFESAAGLYRYLATRPNTVMVLDIGLSGEDGIDICRHLRAHDPQLGIVFVTARSLRQERLDGLAAGADAYLVKPVDIDELALLLRRLGERQSLAAAAQAAVLPEPVQPGTGDARWHVDRDAMALQAPAGGLMKLTLAEFQLLRALERRPDGVCGHAELCSALGLLPEEGSRHRIEVIVSRLRSKAERELGIPLPLRTVRGQGYCWVAQEERQRRDVG